MSRRIKVLVFKGMELSDKQLLKLEECDIYNQIHEVKTIEDELSSYYGLMNCDYIEYVWRNINGKPYVFILDEEGTFKSNPLITGYSKVTGEHLCGTFIIAKQIDTDGELVGLCDLDIENIVSAFRVATLKTTPVKHVCIIEYD